MCGGDLDLLDAAVKPRIRSQRSISSGVSGEALARVRAWSAAVLACVVINVHSALLCQRMASGWSRPQYPADMFDRLQKRRLGIRDWQRLTYCNASSQELGRVATLLECRHTDSGS